MLLKFNLLTLSVLGEQRGFEPGHCLIDPFKYKGITKFLLQQMENCQDLRTGNYKWRRQIKLIVIKMLFFNSMEDILVHLPILPGLTQARKKGTSYFV